MTDLDLDAIEARANAATEGPWESGHEWHEPVFQVTCDPVACANAHFIAHARTDVPALVAALREARAEVERLRTGEADSIAVLSVAWPTTTVPWIAETGVAACVSLLTAERDDWRRRYEALRDGVTGLADSVEYPKPIKGAWGLVLASDVRAVVARVEGDES